MKVSIVLQAFALAAAAVQEVHMTQAQSLHTSYDAVAEQTIKDVVSYSEASTEVGELAEEFSRDLLIGNVPPQLVNVLKSTDPYKGSMHFDYRGNKCVGYGRNIDRAHRGGITEAEAKYLMMNHVRHFEKLLDANAPWTKSLDPVRRGALLNMSFQMGVGSAARGTGVLGFRTSMSYMRQGQYTAASRQLGSSNWARQTPNRARRIAQQIRTGQWVIEGRRSPLPGGMTENLFAQLRVDEGYKPYAYKDSLGYWTFGIGNLIDAKKGGKIRVDEAEYLLVNQLGAIHRQWAAAFPWFNRMTPARQGGLVAFTYKTHFDVVSKFRNAMAAFAASNFPRAAAELLDSGFGKQAPSKARVFTRMVESGRWPSALTLEQLTQEEEEEDFSAALEGAFADFAEEESVDADASTTASSEEDIEEVRM